MRLRSKEEMSFRIRGGKPLIGEITVRGAKNTLPKHLVAALLTDKPCTLHNVSRVPDVHLMSEIIRELGGKAQELRDGILLVSTTDTSDRRLPRLRAFQGISRIPVLLAGPLLHRFRRAMIVVPGGCYLGSRPIDLHLEVLERFGAKIRSRGNTFYLSAPRLVGTTISFRQKSVGATEQAIMTAVLAKGRSTLRNASSEPEVMDLVHCLRSMGARISYSEDGVFKINGITTEELSGYNHIAMTDRSEVASWACAALATGGSIRVRNATPDGLELFLKVFARCGGTYVEDENSITFGAIEASRTRPKGIVEIETGPHPRFRTDWQPPLVAALCTIQQRSLVHETVFENRFGFVNALMEMGAHIDLLSHSPTFRPCGYCASTQPRRHIAAIEPCAGKLQGSRIQVPDLRGGFALLIAALAASGESVLANVNHLDKGYERLPEKLLALGADIELVQTKASLSRSSRHVEGVRDIANRNAALSITDFQIAEFVRLHDKVLRAKDRNEKGQTLESLAEYLFDRFPDLEKVSRRVRGATDELDLVYAVHRIDIAQWRILGNLCVIECKHQTSAVEAKIVRDLRTKIGNRAISSAVIVTTSHLTRDAHEETRFARTSGSRIIVIEGDHLKMIRQGEPPNKVVSERILASSVK